MTKAERQALRELLAKATPGEWYGARHGGKTGWVGTVGHGVAFEYRAPVGFDWQDEDDRNLAAIVAARNALPALLDTIDAYEELLREARYAHNVRGSDGPCDCTQCRKIDALIP